MGTRRFTTRIDSVERADILKEYEDGVSKHIPLADIVRKIESETGRGQAAVRKVISKFADTTSEARLLLRASAATMAQHVIEKGDVDQHIDVLSRPNMDVLKPIQKGEQNFGIFVSVNQDSLGGSSSGGSITQPVRAAITDGTVVEGEVGASLVEAPVGDFETVTAHHPPKKAPKKSPEERDEAAEKRLARRTEEVVKGTHPRTALGKNRPRGRTAKGDSGIHLRYDV